MRVLVDNDSRWSLQILLNDDITDAASADHGEFITLVTGKRRSLLMAGNNDEVCDKKPQRYAEDNVTQW